MPDFFTTWESRCCLSLDKSIIHTKYKYHWFVVSLWGKRVVPASYSQILFGLVARVCSSLQQYSRESCGFHHCFEELKAATVT